MFSPVVAVLTVPNSRYCSASMLMPLLPGDCLTTNPLLLLAESQSYVMTENSVSQPVLVSSTHLGPKTRFLLLSDSCGFVDVGHPILTWGQVCHLQLQLSLTCIVILGSEHCGTLDHILLPQVSDFPILQGQAPVFKTPRNRVVQLHPPGTGFPFHRLLQLAGLWWRYSNPPALGACT
jgi:hypothetical protein